MRKDEAILRLQELYSVSDREAIHSAADAVLLAYLDAHEGKEVADAYRALRTSVTFWYS